jgi:WD40 repeat protein
VFDGHVAAFAPDGRSLLTADSTGLGYWDWPVGRVRHHIVAPRDGVHCFSPQCISPDGKLVAAGINGNRILLWDRTTSSGRLLAGQHAHRLSGLAFSPDGKLLASTSLDGTARLWDVVAGEELAVLPGQGRRLSGVSFTPDGRTLAIGMGSGFQLWHVASRKELFTVELFTVDIQRGGLGSIAFSPDSATLACCGHEEGNPCLFLLHADRELDPGTARGPASK